MYNDMFGVCKSARSERFSHLFVQIEGLCFTALKSLLLDNASFSGIEEAFMNL